MRRQHRMESAAARQDENQRRLYNLAFNRDAGPSNGLGQDQALRFLSLTQGARPNLMQQHPREAP